MSRPSKLTPDQIAIARGMKRNGYQYRHIGRALGVAPETVRRVLDPAYGPMRAAQAAKVKEGLERLRRGQLEQRVFEISPDVLADRDRRSNTPRTLTAMLLGDPPPGYSALDRRSA